MVRISLLMTTLVMTAAPAAATDFGVRTLGGSIVERVVHAPVVVAASGGIRSAEHIAARFGRITSTLRSAAHNRAVGGVANSYHLRGMAMDIARRPSVAHWQIASALREAGYHLIESLDEGDHSHFALGTAQPQRPAEVRQATPGETTHWGLVELSRAVPHEPAI
ncbi:MAG: D-Ala-D-Ala carboxypeptidase family metallohydrolase [Sphingomicrobium sp.]